MDTKNRTTRPPTHRTPSGTLTHSQQTRLTSLAAATGIDEESWMRRAVDNFLECEAPIWLRRSSR